MIAAGLAVGIGLLVTMLKMNWKWRMHVLSNPLFMDAIIFVAMLLIHWGTFSGVMAATIGATVCSLSISAARKAYGYVENGQYVPGYFDVSRHVKSAS